MLYRKWVWALVVETLVEADDGPEFGKPRLDFSPIRRILINRPLYHFRVGAKDAVAHYDIIGGSEYSVGTGRPKLEVMKFYSRRIVRSGQVLNRTVALLRSAFDWIIA